MRSFRMVRRLALATWAACALLIYPAGNAHAGLLPVPLPSVSLVPLPLPTSSPLPLPSVPIVGDLLSPTPTVTGVPAIPLPGQLNDTVGGITGLLGLNGTNGPVQNPTSGGTGGSTSGGTTGQTTGGSKSSNTTSSTSRSHIGSSGLTVLDGIGVITPSQAFDAPYATITGEATKKAAGRALDLAGPLAPPLVLGLIALAVLAMFSRGSTRLVKLDVAGLARRTWRI
jgi:hypothetical protein